MPNILVVEDDENLNRGITFSLKKSGYQVFSAETIKKAKLLSRKTLERRSNPKVKIMKMTTGRRSILRRETISGFFKIMQHYVVLLKTLFVRISYPGA